MWPEKCPDPTFDPDDMVLPPYFPDTPKVREAMTRMYTHIEESDRELGDLLSQLEEDGLADNTIVMHWSDHGPLPRGKRWPYDSGIRVPLIVRWPGGVEPGEVTDRLVNTVDLGPTVLSLAGVEIPAHIQGRAFLGDAADDPREYVFASRDRYDISYDMMRAGRDKRFKYVRNCRPDLPYLIWVPYRNRHPIMQEMWRLHLAGELSGPQELMFQKTRPVEELYDTESDPHEINNLASDPAYLDDLTRLRGAVAEWLDDVGDLGEMSEFEMVRQWYPDGQQPQTASPVAVPICVENFGTEAAQEVNEFQAPILVQLYDATQGASIAYTFEDDDEPAWQLYCAPLELPEGEVTLRAKAIRIGYRESEERRWHFSISR